METLQTFAERLRFARLRAKMSQEELARRADVSKASISKAESSVSQEFLMTTLFRVADALMIDPRWLATGQSPVPDSAVGLPGEIGLNEAFSKLPQDIREPLQQIIDATARAGEQRYWRWVQELEGK
jgi:transcriptional regulator with XRE-family HTH domain